MFLSLKGRRSRQPRPGSLAVQNRPLGPSLARQRSVGISGAARRTQEEEAGTQTDTPAPSLSFPAFYTADAR